ncbi:MAG TPA: hypothetical protein VIC63_04920 [Candidatus Limnocylindria bacterium]|jgi:hypothetical protein
MTWTRVFIAILAVAALVLLIFLLLPLFGVNTGIGPFASSSPAASLAPSASASAAASEPEPSGSASASADASATPPATPTPTDEGWICGLPVTLAASGASIVHIADVRVGTHSDYDRIVFEFAEAGSPAFEMRTRQPPFVHDPSGEPMTVAGSPVMLITLNGATKVGTDGSLVYTGPTDFVPDFPQLLQLVERGDFEAQSSWYAGMDGGDCIRASVQTNPSRIVIDVQH